MCFSPPVYISTAVNYSSHWKTTTWTLSPGQRLPFWWNWHLALGTWHWRQNCINGSRTLFTSPSTSQLRYNITYIIDSLATRAQVSGTNVEPIISVVAVGRAGELIIYFLYVISFYHDLENSHFVLFRLKSDFISVFLFYIRIYHT